MPRKGKGSKPTKGQKNFSNIGSPSTSRKPNSIQIHHTGTIHLGFGTNISGVDQPVESGTSKKETMADQGDHLEGTGDNQVSEGQSTFVFPIVDPDTIS